MLCENSGIPISPMTGFGIVFANDRILLSWAKSSINENKQARSNKVTYSTTPATLTLSRTSRICACLGPRAGRGARSGFLNWTSIAWPLSSQWCSSCDRRWRSCLALGCPRDRDSKRNSNGFRDSPLRRGRPQGNKNSRNPTSKHQIVQQFQSMHNQLT